ncbi:MULTISPECIES: GNAT family N-acetyltransferase [unclassified Arsukibacterium]|uniref:GNAT family N-acetyltransferase n=1 Tax=unclassified Arsukibacterium TaxID=2635278 RepID=UPI000C692A6B|nr:MULTISPECIES: GNAT family N-acetyltransferase [unclassified Arsukibacterium]MAA94662.1 GNAT family N-acetyltransferase [Rheinheimera sp.]MBM32754.1 GNAT family N-acetyltransferase [Rheinheimera sp.]HAW93423.1 GNAT family N-acetyltransferase [Candidatus Azambacteria bacterium]|tara:strand:+ start:4131 stop:4529 length:399 start_codon:yes stop_codon:yes gene_type:complete
MSVSLSLVTEVKLDEAIALYIASGINRPTHQPERMQGMLKHANLIVTARQDNQLVGLARCLTDYNFVVYIADLLVDKAWQQQGIGARLLAEVQRITGPQVQQLLLSAPAAMEYYPKVGFSPLSNAFAIARKE